MTPYDEIKCVLSIKESKFNAKNSSKFSQVRAEGAATPHYGQPDRKRPFFKTPLLCCTIKMSLLTPFDKGSNEDKISNDNNEQPDMRTAEEHTEFSIVAGTFWDERFQSFGRPLDGGGG